MEPVSWMDIYSRILSTAAQSWLTWRGMEEQKKADSETNRFNLELFGKSSAFESAEAAKTRKFQAKENAKEMQYKRYNNFLDRFSSLMNSRPTIAANLIKLNRAME